jgi:hypothetical protein
MGLQAGGKPNPFLSCFLLDRTLGYRQHQTKPVCTWSLAVQDELNLLPLNQSATRRRNSRIGRGSDGYHQTRSRARRHRDPLRNCSHVAE